MLKKTFTYEDFNGVTRTEDHYFHLSKTEITKMQLGTTGGMTALLERMIAAQDIPGMTAVIDEVVEKAYGVKSLDGKRFMKDPEYFKEFKESPAYDMLFIELVTNTDAAVKFMNGIIPQDK